MLYKPNNKRVISTRQFNSISPTVPEIVTEYCPVAIIKIKSSAEVISSIELTGNQNTLTLDKLADRNVTVTMACGLHTMWSHTMNYNDAKSIYNYYLKGWKS